MSDRPTLSSRAASLDDTLRRVQSLPPVVTTLSRLRSVARRFLLVTLIAVGAFCGLLAVAFERYVEWSRDLLIGAALDQSEPFRTILVVLTPAVIFTLLAIVMKSLAPRAAGANLARVRMAYNDDPQLVGPRTVMATFAATPLSLGAGAPLGPEGPIVVVTSGVAAAVGRALHLPRKVARGLIPVGVAAGIAAVFNTPITGVVFALEEVIGAAHRGLLGGVLVGAVAAAAVERTILGGRPLLAAPFSTWSDPRELLGFAIVGVVAGLTSGLAIAAAHRLKRAWTAAMPSMIRRVAVAGLLIGAAGLVAPSTLGVGYDTISFWLHGGGSATGAAIAFAVKAIIFVIAISAGVLGGSFAPSLFMGTALGAAIGHSAQHFFPEAPIDPKAYAIIGMGSSFAGLLRSPIAAVLIVIELTRDYELVVPLMLGVSLAVAVSRRIARFSVVEQQMIDEGYVDAQKAEDPLAQVKARDAMTLNPTALPAETKIGETAALIGDSFHRLYPVIDGEGRLAGVIRREALRDAPDSEAAVRELMERPPVVANDGDDLIELVRRMQMNGIDRCPVVESPSGKLVGFISPTDIVRARTRRSAAAEDEGADFELFET
jgi:CIC family chloride channel protein